MNLEKKDPKHFSDDLKKVLDIITTKRGVYPVGSFSYKIHKYPSDIDIFEYIEYCCDLQSVKYRLANKFKEMADEISNDGEVYLSDFKAGFDRRFFYLKNIKNKDIGTKIKEDELIPDNKKKKLLNLLNDNKLKEYLEEVRILYTIRWELKEIQKGEKKIAGGKTIKLSNAIVDNSDVKIDLIGEVDGNFKEISNYFYINMKDEKGNITNLTKKPQNRIKSLDKDIEKYGGGEKRNSLKFAKRLWLKSILLKRNKIVNKLNPLFSGDPALMNQVKSEMDALLILFNKYKLNKKTLLIIHSQIDSFKSRLSYVKTDLNKVYIMLDEVLGKIDEILSNSCDYKVCTKLIVKNIVKISKDLSLEIEKESADFLKSVGINYGVKREIYNRKNKGAQKYFLFSFV